MPKAPHVLPTRRIRTNMRDFGVFCRDVAMKVAGICLLGGFACSVHAYLPVLPVPIPVISLQPASAVDIEIVQGANSAPLAAVGGHRSPSSFLSREQLDGEVPGFADHLRRGLLGALSFASGDMIDQILPSTCRLDAPSRLGESQSRVTKSLPGERQHHGMELLAAARLGKEDRHAKAAVSVLIEIGWAFGRLLELSQE